MIDVAVIEDPAAAEAVLDPARARLLAQLAEPRSATMLAAAAGLPRQKVNYHLRTLERHGLVELVAERRKGNVTERLLQAAAGSFVISPAALAEVAPDPARAPDRLSARWLLALAAQLVRDVGGLITASARANKRLATFAMDGEVRFASAAERAAFTEELTHAVTALVAKYHDENAEGGRAHRLVIAVHPSAAAGSPGTAAGSPGAAAGSPGAVGSNPGAVGNSPGAVGSSPGAVGSSPGAAGDNPGAGAIKPSAGAIDPSAESRQEES